MQAMLGQLQPFLLTTSRHQCLLWTDQREKMPHFCLRTSHQSQFFHPGKKWPMRAPGWQSSSTDQLCFVVRHAQGIVQALFWLTLKKLKGVSFQVVSVIREAKTLGLFPELWFIKIHGRPENIILVFQTWHLESSNVTQHYPILALSTKYRIILIDMI